jgi:hypothetical protein
MSTSPVTAGLAGGPDLTKEEGWYKSPYSVDGHCVQLHDLPGGGVAVRDSKDPNGPFLRFTAEEWTAFRLGIITGAV